LKNSGFKLHLQKLKREVNGDEGYTAFFMIQLVYSLLSGCVRKF
jgi:hypothetical protein